LCQKRTFLSDSTTAWCLTDAGEQAAESYPDMLYVRWNQYRSGLKF